MYMKKIEDLMSGLSEFGFKYQYCKEISGLEVMFKVPENVSFCIDTYNSTDECLDISCDINQRPIQSSTQTQFIFPKDIRFNFTLEIEQSKEVLSSSLSFMYPNSRYAVKKELKDITLEDLLAEFQQIEGVEILKKEPKACYDIKFYRTTNQVDMDYDTHSNTAKFLVCMNDINPHYSLATDDHLYCPTNSIFDFQYINNTLDSDEDILEDILVLDDTPEETMSSPRSPKNK